MSCSVASTLGPSSRIFVGSFFNVYDRIQIKLPLSSCLIKMPPLTMKYIFTWREVIALKFAKMNKLEQQALES